MIRLALLGLFILAVMGAVMMVFKKAEQAPPLKEDVLANDGSLEATDTDHPPTTNPVTGQVSASEHSPTVTPTGTYPKPSNFNPPTTPPNGGSAGTGTNAYPHANHPPLAPVPPAKHHSATGTHHKKHH